MSESADAYGHLDEARIFKALDAVMGRFVQVPAPTLEQVFNLFG